MSTGKETSKNTRPTNAGLKMLQPSPPNDIFAIPIATKLPITTIHNGNVLGRLNDSNTPVMMAEQSSIEQSSFLKSHLLMTNSKNKHEATAVIVSINDEMPKTTIENMKAGTNAIKTLHIKRCVLVSD